MKLKRNNYLSIIVIMLVALVLSMACSQVNEEHKGALSVRLNLDIYEAKTTPYEEKIIFELSSDEMLKEIVEPIKITTAHETTLYVTEIFERDDSIVVLTVGFKYNYQSQSGEMLSLYHLNEDGTFTNSGVIISVFDGTGEKIDIARGSGDGERDGYEQWVGVQIPKELLTDKKKLTFELAGLNILSYRER